jgi:NADH-quinone oxidoreductase subunit J
MTELTLFYAFSFISVISAIMVISARNPVHSVLFLILVFLNASGLLLLIEAEFIAMIFIVVYVGAIAVLFLFVVMMLDIKIAETNREFSKYLPFGSLIGFIFFIEIFLIMNNEVPSLNNTESYNLTNNFFNWKDQLDPITNLEALGQVLYTYYFVYFLIAGLILLVAMIGAIVLTMQLNRQVRRQAIYRQVSRNFENAIFLTTPSNNLR